MAGLADKGGGEAQGGGTSLPQGGGGGGAQQARIASAGCGESVIGPAWAAAQGHCGGARWSRRAVEGGQRGARRRGRGSRRTPRGQREMAGLADKGGGKTDFDSVSFICCSGAPVALSGSAAEGIPDLNFFFLQYWALFQRLLAMLLIIEHPFKILRA